jgi:hypothetical protein
MFLIAIIAAPTAFIAMNPMGALSLFAATGEFVVTAMLDVIKGGAAMVWWLFQAAYTGVANLLIGTGNLVVQAINNFFRSLIPGWSPMPLFEYLQAPSVSPTIQSIVDDIVSRYMKVQTVAQDYVAGVQQNAPMSYVVGGAAGTGSAVLAGAVIPKKPKPILPPAGGGSQKKPRLI